MASPKEILSAPDVQRKIVDQYLAGIGVTKIAEEVGVWYASVREYLVKQGVYRRAPDFPLARFESSFIVTPGCWLWTAEIGISGYGRFWAKQRRHRAHRFSYETYKGPIPKGLLVLHSCDNPRCVNPDHLRVGTNYDNTQDKIARNRFNLKRRTSMQI